MTLKYKDFINTFMSDMSLSDEQFGKYTIYELDIKSILNYGIGFIPLLDRFANKFGLTSKDYPFKHLLSGNVVHMENFILVNNFLVEKIYKNNNQRHYFNFYVKLGNELEIEI